MSYGIPTFRLNGKNLVHFSAFKEHIGFYPTPSGIEKFKKGLSAYEGAKGSVKFPLDKPIKVIYGVHHPCLNKDGCLDFVFITVLGGSAPHKVDKFSVYLYSSKYLSILSGSRICFNLWRIKAAFLGSISMPIL